MSLLPIIYNSLIIFSAFATIVLVFSYFASKARRRSKPSFHNNSIPVNIEDKKNNQTYINNYQTPSAKSIEPIQNPVFVNKSNAKYLEENHCVQSKQIRTQNKVNNHYESPKQFKKQNKYPVAVNAKRIEILNELDKTETTIYGRADSFAYGKNFSIIPSTAVDQSEREDYFF